MKKYLVLIIATIFVFNASGINAYTSVALTDLTLDTTIRQEADGFALPNAIVVSPIFIDETDYKESIKGLFYYTIDKLGFPDIPFHYIVTADGIVYKGNTGGDERKLSFSNASGNFLLIAYVTNKNVDQFEAKGLLALKELTSEVSNNNYVNADNVIIRDLTFVKDVANNTVNLQINPLDGNWNNSAEDIRNYVRGNVKPSNKVYMVDVVSSVLSKEQVAVGETVAGTVTLKNTGTSTLYVGTNSEIIATKETGNVSFFYTPTGWLSQTQFSLMDTLEQIGPGEEAELPFSVSAPLASGEITENFIITNILGQRVSQNNFTLRMNVDKAGKRIIQINDTELGYLRVRAEASTAATEVGRASSGERFIVQEDAGNGLLRIVLPNGVSGWVAGWLTTEI